MITKDIAINRLKEKAIDVACSINSLDEWFTVDIDDKDGFFSAEVFVTEETVLGFGKYPDEINHKVELRDLKIELPESMEETLNEYMASCSRLRDFERKIQIEDNKRYLDSYLGAPKSFYEERILIEKRLQKILQIRYNRLKTL